MKKLLIIIVFLAGLNYVNAVNCGGETMVACSCGDTVVGSYLLQNDLNCDTDYALKMILPFGAEEDLILDCNKNTINNNMGTQQNKGIEILNQDFNYKIIMQNCVVKNFEKGVSFSVDSSGEVNITSNSFINNKYGIYMEDVLSNTIIEKNSFSGNGLGTSTGAINLRRGNTPLDINHNCIINNVGAGILIDYPNVDLTSIKINYNTLDENLPQIHNPYDEEIRLCFDNGFWSGSQGQYYNPSLSCNGNPLNKVDITNNFWNYAGDWDESALNAEIYEPTDSQFEADLCCPGDTPYGNLILYSATPYLPSNPIPDWEICDDGYDNDCDTLIDYEDIEDCPMCGNGNIDPGEECEGSNLNSQTCSTQGFLGGTLSCIPPGSQNECTFDTSNCYNCGVDGATCSNLNQQSTCCTSVQSPPGFTCRYYEFESISYPYAKKCCENGDETERMCAQNAYTPQNGLFSITTCSSNPTDIACCDGAQDCVYENKCYTDDGDYTRADIVVDDAELTCTSKHWCPVGFTWDEDVPPDGACTPVANPCNGPLPQFCPYDILTNTVNYFNTNQCFVIGPTYTSDSCCYDFSLGIFDIYNWDGIMVYNTDGAIVTSGSGSGS